MSTPRQRPAAPTEEELLQQWAFLDSLVERQAAQLRAGLQDLEEPDDIGGAPQSAELEAVRASLSAAEAERDELGRRLAFTERQLSLTRAQVETLERERAAERARSQEAIDALQSRLRVSEAARLRAETGIVETRAALEQAEQELQALRDRLAASHRGFWRLGRRPPSG